jgi:hypothetical protein
MSWLKRDHRAQGKTAKPWLSDRSSCSLRVESEILAPRTKAQLEFDAPVKRDHAR